MTRLPVGLTVRGLPTRTCPAAADSPATSNRNLTLVTLLGVLKVSPSILLTLRKLNESVRSLTWTVSLLSFANG